MPEVFGDKWQMLALTLEALRGWEGELDDGHTN